MESSVEVVSVHWPLLPVEAGRTLVHVDISPDKGLPFALYAVTPPQPRDLSNPVKNGRPPPLFYRLFESCCSSLPRFPRWCSSRKCQITLLQFRIKKRVLKITILQWNWTISIVVIFFKRKARRFSRFQRKRKISFISKLWFLNIHTFHEYKDNQIP